MKRWIAAAATAAALGVAGQAQAAVDLGPGTSPRVVVDPRGTAHIVYLTDFGAAYCRLPRGAKSCDVRAQMPLDDSEGAAYILRRPSDGALIVVQSSDDFPDIRTWVRTSLDNGATWSGAVSIATGTSDFDDVQLSADGAAVITISTDITEGVSMQWAPLAGGQSRVLPLAAKPDGSSISLAHEGAEIAVLRDNRVLMVEETEDFHGLYRLFGGGDPYDQNAWQPFPERRFGDGADPRLATGPRGTFVMTARTPADQLLDGKPAFRVRSLDARRGRLRTGRQFAGDDRVNGNNVSQDLAEDARGRLHAAWTTGLGSRTCVVYARTRVSRRSWFGPTTTLWVTRRDKRAPDDVRVAATRSGRGVAVWDDSRFGGAAVRHVRVTTLRQKRGKARRLGPFDRPGCPR